MKGVIFDMDGTMVDNMMVHHRAWQQVLAEHGLPLELEVVKEKIHGINEEILERLFGDKYTPEERREISWKKESMYREIFLKDLKLINGCLEFIQQMDAKGVPMVVASAAPPENVDFVLDNLDLRKYFMATFHSKSVSHGKPHPEIFLKACAALGFEPNECVVFEDSPTGAKASANAGCHTVIITTTHEPNEFEGITGIVDFINDFEQLKLEELQLH